MAENHIIRLEAVFNSWVKSRGEGVAESKQFLLYAVEQILKSYPCTDEDISYGIVDNGSDGGIDAVYVIADHNVFVRDNNDSINRKAKHIKVISIQSKSSKSKTGFKTCRCCKISLIC